MFLIIFIFSQLILCYWSYDIPESPCPDIFKYKQQQNLWIGDLKILTKYESFPLNVKIHMCLRAILKTKYAGLLELTNPAEIVIDRIKSLSTDYVNYTIRFPIPWPLPTVRYIFVNNHEICAGLQATDGVVTNLFLEHTFPTNKKLFEDQNVNKNQCGINAQNGTNFEETNWPWLAAILIKKSLTFEFHCGGTLISDKYILTAAHCIKSKKYPDILIENFMIYLGRHNLSKLGETHSQTRTINQYILHPDYSIDYFGADIALLLLNETANINSYVRPICLWSSTENLSSIIGNMGVIVGWGKNHSSGKLRMVPRAIHLPLATQEECLRSRKDFLYITSSRTLCAGFRNGTGPCNGDSGSGLMLIRQRPTGFTTWELRAIISLSLFDLFNQSCDLSQYIVFTDVAKFTDWISFMTNITI